MEGTSSAIRISQNVASNIRTLPVPQKRQKTERTFPTKTGLSL